jgi:very-short-patch-repair endonuclease
MTVMQLWKRAWKDYGLGKIPRTEYRFHLVRKYRFDFAWPDEKVAVEIDGFGGGHQSKVALSKDNEKTNLAQQCGWIVLRYTARQLGNEEKRRAVVAQVKEVLEQRKQR